MEHDEALLTIVAVRTDGYIEDLFVNKTGQHVIRASRYSGFTARKFSWRKPTSSSPRAPKGGGLDRTRTRTRRRDASDCEPWSPAEPHRRGTQDQHQSANHRLAAPADWRRDREESHQRPTRQAGDELYRIADHSHVWVIADVAEADIASIEVGMPATVTFAADPTHRSRAR